MAVQQRVERPREGWSGFFEGVTKERAGQDVTIELLDRTFDDGTHTIVTILARPEPGDD